MAFDIADGAFSLSMMGSIESVGMPASFDISSGISMLSAVMQGTALDSTYDEIKGYRKELDEAARMLNMHATTISALSSTALTSGTSRSLNSRALATMAGSLSQAERTKAAAQLVYEKTADRRGSNSASPKNAQRMPMYPGHPMHIPAHHIRTIGAAALVAQGNPDSLPELRRRAESSRF